MIYTVSVPSLRIHKTCLEARLPKTAAEAVVRDHDHYHKALDFEDGLEVIVTNEDEDEFRFMVRCTPVYKAHGEEKVV